MYRLAQDSNMVEQSGSPKEKNDLQLGSKTIEKLSLAVDNFQKNPTDPSSIDSLVYCLRDAELILPDFGAGGEWTWYRLPEWLQVEMIRSFGEFLMYEPWFRFPFKDVFLKYLSILKQENEIVREQFGLKTAFLSMGFIINFVPALIMGGNIITYCFLQNIIE